MEPRPTHQPITAADVQRLYEQLPAPRPPFDIQPVGRYRPERRPPPVIDGAPEFPEAALQEVQQKLAADENAWLTRHLVEALQLAGESATLDNLPTFAPRLSLRSYESGVRVVALDSQPIGQGPGMTLGRQLFGFGPAQQHFEGLYSEGPVLMKTSWPVLSGDEALAYELSLKKYPAEAFAYGLGIDEEPAGIDERLQNLHLRYGYGVTYNPGSAV